MAEKTKNTGVFIPDVTVEMLKKVPIKAIEALLSEGEILDIDIEEIKESAYQRGLGQNKWIPVSERLPSEPFGCLVTVWDSTPTGEGEDFENILPYFVGWDGKRWNDEDGEQCPFEIVAWMPLPEPYKESEEEQMQTFGFCVYHEIECDYKGLCIECPHNTKEDKEWFEEDERKERDTE